MARAILNGRGAELSAESESARGLALHRKTYAHVIETLAGRRYPDLDALIGAARADLMFPCVPRARTARAERRAEHGANVVVKPKPESGFEPLTPCLQDKCSTN